MTDICKYEADECQNQANHHDRCPGEFEEQTDIDSD